MLGLRGDFKMEFMIDNQCVLCGKNLRLLRFHLLKEFCKAIRQILPVLQTLLSWSTQGSVDLNIQLWIISCRSSCAPAGSSLEAIENWTEVVLLYWLYRVGRISLDFVWVVGNTDTIIDRSKFFEGVNNYYFTAHGLVCLCIDTLSFGG